MAFFSPDGKSVILSSFHTVILVLEVMTGKELFRMTHDERVEAINISADGNYLVSGSQDHTARVWDLSTGQEIARMIHDDEVELVSFSPDGKCVVSGSYDKTVRIWTWQASDLITNACKVMPRNLTRAEWQQYIGDALPYQAVCENLPIENSQDQQ
jgi:WD40 repeat protein